MKLVYLHGFRSSGETATAKRLQKHLPRVEVIAPDIPLDPVVAISRLKELAKSLGPDDIVVGTSMGGMFASLFKGWRRILINPSFHTSRIIRKDLNKTVDFFTPRKDGIQSFKITDKLCKKFETMESKIFNDDFGVIAPWRDNNDKENVMAFFGSNDTTVDCKEEYLEHYQKHAMFEGEHRLDPETILNIVIPQVNEYVSETQKKEES